MADANRDTPPGTHDKLRALREERKLIQERIAAAKKRRAESRSPSASPISARLSPNGDLCNALQAHSPELEEARRSARRRPSLLEPSIPEESLPEPPLLRSPPEIPATISLGDVEEKDAPEEAEAEAEAEADSSRPQVEEEEQMEEAIGTAVRTVYTADSALPEPPTRSPIGDVGLKKAAEEPPLDTAESRPAGGSLPRPGSNGVPAGEAEPVSMEGSVEEVPVLHPSDAPTGTPESKEPSMAEQRPWTGEEEDGGADDVSAAEPFERKADGTQVERFGGTFTSDQQELAAPVSPEAPAESISLQSITQTEAAGNGAPHEDMAGSGEQPPSLETFQNHDPHASVPSAEAEDADHGLEHGTEGSGVADVLETPPGDGMGVRSDDAVASPGLESVGDRNQAFESQSSAASLFGSTEKTELLSDFGWSPPPEAEHHSPSVVPSVVGTDSPGEAVGHMIPSSGSLFSHEGDEDREREEIDEGAVIENKAPLDEQSNGPGNATPKLSSSECTTPLKERTAASLFGASGDLDFFSGASSPAESFASDSTPAKAARFTAAKLSSSDPFGRDPTPAMSRQGFAGEGMFVQAPKVELFGAPPPSRADGGAGSKGNKSVGDLAADSSFPPRQRADLFGSPPPSQVDDQPGSAEMRRGGDFAAASVSTGAPKANLFGSPPPSHVDGRPGSAGEKPRKAEAGSSPSVPGKTAADLFGGGNASSDFFSQARPAVTTAPGGSLAALEKSRSRMAPSFGNASFSAASDATALGSRQGSSQAAPPYQSSLPAQGVHQSMEASAPGTRRQPGLAFAASGGQMNPAMQTFAAAPRASPPGGFGVVEATFANPPSRNTELPDQATREAPAPAHVAGNAQAASAPVMMSGTTTRGADLFNRPPVVGGVLPPGPVPVAASSEATFAAPPQTAGARPFDQGPSFPGVPPAASAGLATHQMAHQSSIQETPESNTMPTAGVYRSASPSESRAVSSRPPEATRATPHPFAVPSALGAASQHPQSVQHLQSFPNPAQSVPYSSGNRDNRLRPAGVIATFGFGGKLVYMFPTRGAKFPTPGAFHGSSQATGPGAGRDATTCLKKGPIQVAPIARFVDVSSFIPDMSSTGNVAKPMQMHPGVFAAPDPSTAARPFPGPLINAKESDLESFLERRIEQTSAADSEGLLWRVFKICYACEGRLRSESSSDASGAAGSPEGIISDLLLASAKAQGSDQQLQASQMLTSPAPEGISLIEETLLKGEREEALRLCMEHGHAGLAMLVASVCSKEVYQATVRAYLGQLSMPGRALHTIGMLYSKQVEMILSKDEASGQSVLSNWQETIVAILGNKSSGWDRILREFGDRLGNEVGNVTGAHVAYLLSGMLPEAPFASARMVLPGVDHRSALHTTLKTRESVWAFYQLELLEYSRRKSNSQSSITSAQGFKLLYAALLADLGFLEQALRYVHSVQKFLSAAGASLKKQEGGGPYTSSFVKEVMILEDRLLGALGRSSGGSSGASSSSQNGMRWGLGGLFSSATERLTRVLSDSTLAEGTADTGRSADNPSIAVQQLTAPQQAERARSQPPAPVATQQAAAEAPPARSRDGRPPRRTSKTPPPSMKGSAEAAAAAAAAAANHLVHTQSLPNIRGMDNKREAAQTEASKVDKRKEPNASAGPKEEKPGWLKSFFTKLVHPEATIAHEGEEMQAYYDEATGRWVFPGQEEPEASSGPPSAPPTGMGGEPQGGPPSTAMAEGPGPSSAQASTTEPLDPLAALIAPPSTSAVSAYSRRGARSRYVDTFNPGMQPGGAAAPPVAVPQSGAPPAAPSFFMPTAPDPGNSATGPPPNFIGFSPPSEPSFGAPPAFGFHGGPVGTSPASVTEGPETAAGMPGSKPAT